MSNVTANDVIAYARSLVGKNERDNSHRSIIDEYNTITPIPRGYRASYTDPWCAIFISALGKHFNATDVIFPECSAEMMIREYQKKGKWIESDSITPITGDIIFFEYTETSGEDNTVWADHVGIVEYTLDNYIYYIEGNASDRVQCSKIKINGKYIRGFARPNYNVVVDKTEIAKAVIRGEYGNGSTRKKLLEEAGYNYTEIQSIVNDYLALANSVTSNEIALNAVAMAVIRGDFGNGAERVKRLEEAGYDYNTVQKKVNEILRKG